MPASPSSSRLDLEREGVRAASRLPALLADANSLASTVAAGAHGRRRAGTGETFWQYRDYAFGDAATAIDWRQSARAPSRLFVRETEWETAATVRLWCDGTASFDYAANGVPPKRWRGQVIAMALGLLLTKAGEKIGPLCTRGGPGPARSGQTAVMALADHLLSALPMPAEDGALPSLPRGTSQAIFISDFYAPTDNIVAHIEGLAAAGTPCHLVQISDPSEESFPFDGRVLFEGQDPDAKPVLFGDAKAVQADYQAARRAHLGALKAVCARYGFTYLSHSTDNPPAATLAALHASVSGHR